MNALLKLVPSCNAYLYELKNKLLGMLFFASPRLPFQCHINYWTYACFSHVGSKPNTSFSSSFTKTKEFMEIIYQ